MQVQLNTMQKRGKLLPESGLQDLDGEIKSSKELVEKTWIIGLRFSLSRNQGRYPLGLRVMLKKLSLVNGMLFTGGSEKHGLYFETIKKVFQYVLDKNDAGDPFPLFAQCLGFELVSMIVSKGYLVGPKAASPNGRGRRRSSHGKSQDEQRFGCVRRRPRTAPHVQHKNFVVASADADAYIEVKFQPSRLDGA